MMDAHRCGVECGHGFRDVLDRLGWGSSGQTGDADIAATDLKRFMARQTFDAAFKLKLGVKVKLPPESCDR
jgi:hypothetical protein